MEGINNMRVSFVMAWAVVVAAFAAGLAAYPMMPDRLASHWGISGEVDGYMPKTMFSAFLLPAITAVLVAFMALIPSIDPMKANIREFRSYYDNFIMVFTVFMALIYAQTLLWNLGTRINPFHVIAPGFGLIAYYSGVLLEKSKRNWFIGIRTPWTLSSDAVWEKTHKVGARLFKASGFVAFLGVLAPPPVALALVLLPLMGSSAYTIVYSYLEYQKEEKH
jgi:uncharacterized membrane protein